MLLIMQIKVHASIILKSSLVQPKTPEKEKEFCPQLFLPKAVCSATRSDSPSCVQSLLIHLYDAVHAVVAATPADTFSGCWVN